MFGGISQDLFPFRATAMHQGKFFFATNENGDGAVMYTNNGYLPRPSSHASQQGLFRKVHQSCIATMGQRRQSDPPAK